MSSKSGFDPLLTYARTPSPESLTVNESDADAQRRAETRVTLTPVALRRKRTSARRDRDQRSTEE
jgi:hypothetical protein